ncbi:MAG: LPS export ABC transporter periplasmic protein LptC [Gammaproteobacteria bacterium]|nr:MAG: LPS export ABC transporter periplasmic protein LptC [Gammaproteobacteria bacterium]
MNAISNIPFSAKVFLAIFAIISVWLLSGEQSNSPEKAEISDLNKASDYAMTNFTMTVMDKQGNPVRIIKGQEMAHYPEDDSTEIIFPVSHFTHPEKETWVVSANKGHTVGKGEDILLTGNVVITQPNTAAIELRTEELHLDTVHNTAYTDQAVKMKSPHGWTDSVGLHASLQQKTINLHSRVKGRYDAPPTQ